MLQKHMLPTWRITIFLEYFRQMKLLCTMRIPLDTNWKFRGGVDLLHFLQGLQASPFLTNFLSVKRNVRYIACFHRLF